MAGRALRTAAALHATLAVHARQTCCKETKWKQYGDVYSYNLERINNNNNNLILHISLLSLSLILLVDQSVIFVGVYNVFLNE